MKLVKLAALGYDIESEGFLNWFRFAAVVSTVRDMRASCLPELFSALLEPVHS